ncbi:MAG: gliding motility-associated C-terminal domain-containing protein [Bacteroidales bacterium]|jgi:gliding motility-associated-like protein|nr:gliding motility-associated C-terminal domain-containing protein [Bacteroidales bacterium]MDI9576429.1 gliding motility-associated C-terminal domain-containing protein [Bacteroidota bacterium]MDY0400374.1 gliding motility-associated C-terminal domain-containing protein [Bacteroidales bacterium]HHW59555.1 hypothetical protein [Bacteroidales bacterium]
MKQIIFFLFLVIFPHYIFTQVSIPELRCLEVLNNGDVSINWLPSNDVNGDFIAYEIFYSVNINGPYTLISTINNINTTNYLHVSAQANMYKVHYYIKAKYGSPINYTENSDTLSTIYLSLTDPLNGTAILSWNELHQPPLTSFSNYEILREYPSGIWSTIGNTISTNFIDTIYPCSASISYQIKQIDNSGCYSLSNISSGIFHNLMPPKSPFLDSVTVLSNGSAALGWQPSNSADVIAYIIYKYESGFWTPIDTVSGTNYYVYSDSNADESAEQYRVAALDSCGNTSPLSNAIETIFLNGSLDICNNIFYLSWNHPTGVLNIEKYKIFLSKNTQPFIEISNTIRDSFNLPIDDTVGYWCVFIQSINNLGNTQSSNVLCFNFKKPSLPAYVKFRKADFINNRINISWKCPPHTSTLGFSLYRSTDSLISFKKIATIQKNLTGDYIFVDPLTNYTSYPIFYTLATIDSCGNEVFQSDTVSTICLNGTVNFDITNSLFWQGKASSSVINLQQILHKKIDNQPYLELNLPFDQRTYLDDLVDLEDIESSGHFSYQIEWIVYLDNPFDDYDTIHSLWLDLFQPPRIYIPTGFTPNSHLDVNKIFKPSGIFLKAKDYSFTIFDRNGRIVFETNDLDKGWDGNSFDGKPEPEQLYVYLLKITLINGKVFEKRGIVMLYR